MTAAARRQRLALWVAFVMIIVWGANFSVQKAVFDVTSPGAFLFVRYLIMPICALALLVWRYGLSWPRIPRADLLQLAVLGFFGHFLHVGMVVHGIHWSTAFSSSLILACGPIFTLLILRWAGIEALRRPQVIGVAIACAGVLVFLSDKLLSGSWGATGGDLLLLVAASMFSYYTVGAKPLIERHGGIVVMSYATLLVSPLIALVWLPSAWSVQWTALSPAIWVALLWSVIISAFLGWLAWGWINAVRGVARSAPLMYLMPPVAGVVAWIFTDEAFTGMKLLGAAVTLGGVAYAQFTGRTELKWPDPPDRSGPAGRGAKPAEPAAPPVTGPLSPPASGS
jgi:drug/metabolite transporter (DMT)-like permease